MQHAVWRPGASGARPATIDADPDTVRDAACSLTAADDICNPVAPPPTQPPDIDPSDIAPSAADVAGGSGAVGTVLVWVLVAVLATALVWLAVVWWRDRVGRTREASDDDTDDTDDVDDDDVDDDADDAPAAPRIVDHSRPPDRWRAAAAEHRTSGRYRDAVRCEYRALVGDLARRGVVDEIPGRTSGEERRQVERLSTSAAPAFDRAADLFDVAWFTSDEVTAADDAAFRAAAADVLAAGRDRDRSTT